MSDDEKAFEKWLKTKPRYYELPEALRVGWNAAIAHERKRILEVLEKELADTRYMTAMTDGRDWRQRIGLERAIAITQGET